jgi:DNA-binding NtrC family response regulator
VLERSGYRIVSAASVAEAIEASQQHTFDLLISDVLLPDGVGPDLFRRLTQAQPDLRVLYASGYAPEATLDLRQLDARAAFLGKPFTPDVLTRKVREVLDR